MTTTEAVPDTMEARLRHVLAGQLFGVLATLYAGRLHTSTIHFAETPELELVFAIRPTTLKARLAEGNAHVAFQVDTREAVSRGGEFVRLSFDGAMRVLSPSDPDYDLYARVYRDKLPVGAVILASDEIDLWVMRPTLVRIAVGGAPAEDIAITYQEEDAPSPITEDEEQPASSQQSTPPTPPPSQFRRLGAPRAV